MRKRKSELFKVEVYGIETFPIARVYRRQKGKRANTKHWVQVTIDQPLGSPRATKEQLAKWIGEMIVTHSSIFREWFTKK